MARTSALFQEEALVAASGSRAAAAAGAAAPAGTQTALEPTAETPLLSGGRASVAAVRASVAWYLSVKSATRVDQLDAEYFSVLGSREFEAACGEGVPGVKRGWSWRGTSSRRLHLGPAAPVLNSAWSKFSPM